MFSFNLNLLILKFFALFCMLIDHLYKINLIPPHFIFIFLGRLAFPLFLFILVKNFFTTSNLAKYKKRLLIFAFISQVPYNFFSFYVKGDITELNILFTLLSCLLFLELIQNFQYIQNKFSLILKGTIILLFNLFCDYPFLSLLYTYYFYLLEKEKTFFFNTSPFFTLLGIYYVSIFLYNVEQLFALFALFIIFIFALKLPQKTIFLSQQKKKFLQNFFYIFYPTHFMILIFIDILLTIF
ncbi:MAG: TraX family protein [Thermofilaceae archaeon]